MSAGENYAETVVYEGKNPFRILDIVQEMDDLSWKYECSTPGRERFNGSSDELIEEIVELEHSRKQYFQSYDISVGSDGEVLLSKEYSTFRSSDTVLPLNDEHLDIELIIRGQMEQDAIEELIL